MKLKDYTTEYNNTGITLQLSSTVTYFIITTCMLPTSWNINMAMTEYKKSPESDELLTHLSVIIQVFIFLNY